MRGRLREEGKCLGWSGWSRGQEGELGSGLRLLGARASDMGLQVLRVRRGAEYLVSVLMYVLLLCKLRST